MFTMSMPCASSMVALDYITTSISIIISMFSIDVCVSC